MPLTGTYGPSTSAHAREQAEVYEATGGAEGGTLGGRPVVVVTSVGARSGLLRKTALMRVEHDGVYAIVASKGGAPEHPEWYRNLAADPRAELQDGAERWDVLARELEGTERGVWWARAVAAYPPYADYAAKTDRIIPVLLLEPSPVAHDAVDDARAEVDDARVEPAAAADDAHAAEILEFWEVARARAGLMGSAVVTGPGVTASLVPQTWSFGDDARLADELLGLVLDGVKTATSSAVAEYGPGEPLPQAGELSIVLDGERRPRALLRTTDVTTVPFSDVDEVHARREGEGDRSLEHWRTEHERYWRRVLGIEGDFDASTSVVLERFELLYPRPGDRGAR